MVYPHEDSERDVKHHPYHKEDTFRYRSQGGWSDCEQERDRGDDESCFLMRHEAEYSDATESRKEGGEAEETAVVRRNGNKDCDQRGAKELWEVSEEVGVSWVDSVEGKVFSARIVEYVI